MPDGVEYLQVTDQAGPQLPVGVCQQQGERHSTQHCALAVSTNFQSIMACVEWRRSTRIFIPLKLGKQVYHRMHPMMRGEPSG